MPVYYANGFIFDSNGALLKDVSIQLCINATGELLFNPFLTTDGTYDAWTDRSPYEIAVVFKKKGYKDQKIQISTLQETPDVVMIKGSTIPLTSILIVLAAVTLYRRKTKKVGKLSTDDIYPIMLIVGGLIAFSVIKEILEGLGIWDSQDSKTLDNASTDPDSWWNPNFWKTKPSNIPYTNPITTTTARQLANTIYNSFSWYNDNEEQAISVFKSLPSRAAGSFLAEVFANDHGQDMLTFLRGGTWPQDRLSDADVNEVNRYVNNLPKY